MNIPKKVKISDDEFKVKYGLKNLEEKVKNPRPDYAILEKGVDLTTFGLNLSSSEQYF